MRRDMFLRSLAALAAAGALPLTARASANLKMMIPANPGGGWDGTGRALGKALQDAGVASSISYDNKGGAAGAIGLAQFVNAAKGDGNALMVMGAVMLGGIITGKPPVSLSQATPIARLTSEYNVFVLPANSPLKTMKDVVDQLKKDPGSVKWGGGSRGSTEHIAAAMLAREVGVDAAKINYVAFRGGGEAVAAILGGTPGILHGSRSLMLQDADGQVTEAHSASAGLDYPGIGPQLAALAEGKPAQAVAHFTEALTYAPDSVEILTLLFGEPFAAAVQRTGATLGCVAAPHNLGKGKAFVVSP